MSMFPSSLRACLPLLMLCAVGCTDATDAQVPPPVDTIAPDILQGDFDALHEGLRDAHYDLYVRRDRAAYDALFASMRAGFDRPMTPLQARVAFQRFVAYGNVAHARIDPPLEEWERFRAAGGKAFPLYVRVKGDEAFVLDGYAGLPGVEPGDRLLSIDGVPAMAWLGRMRAHLSADNDYMAWAQLERQLPLLAWLELGEVDRFTVALVKSDGREPTIDVPARNRAMSAETDAKAPPRFELDWNDRQARLLGDDVAYLRPGPFYDNRPEASHPWDPTAFHRFIDEAFGDFIAQGATRLLIDLRDNPGGDNSFSDPLVAWFADRPFRFSDAFEIKVSAATVQSNRERLEGQGGDGMSAKLAAAYEGQPEGSIVLFPIPVIAPRAAPRFEGGVYVLVNRHSYSNAVLVAAIVQDYGFATVLGEETSDLASTYGAMEHFVLPGTGFRVGYPKARILRPNGDPAARGVVPDIAIETPMSSEEDVVLEAALGIVRQGLR